MNHMSPAQGKNERQVPRLRGRLRPSRECGRSTSYLAAPSIPESSMPEHQLPIFTSITIWGQLITRDPATRPWTLAFSASPPRQMFPRPSGHHASRMPLHPGASCACLTCVRRGEYRAAVNRRDSECVSSKRDSDRLAVKPIREPMYRNGFRDLKVDLKE